MSLILATLVLLQSAPATEADKFEAALKKFGERKYRIFENGNAVGLCTLSTRVTEQKDGAPVAVFEDHVEKAGASPLVLDYKEKASLKGLKLLWATRVDGGPKEDDPTILVESNEAHITSDQGNMVLDKVLGAIGERALLRLLCTMEPKVGLGFQVSLLTLDPIDYHRKQEIKCVAAETIEIGGKKVETHKWSEKRDGKSILSGQPIPYKVDNSYWISKDGVLVKFTSGSMEMVLDAK